MAAPSLRQRNRLQAMRLVQATAVEQFEVSGFESTTIEAIAAECGVSPSTVYRHFGTKENLVLWDEVDPLIDAEVLHRLGTTAPIRAFRDAVVAALGDRADSGLFLRRLRLVYSEPAIWTVAAREDRVNRVELAAAIGSSEGRRCANLADEFVAAVCLAALDVALDHWQQGDGEADLAELIDQAIGAASALE